MRLRKRVRAAFTMMGLSRHVREAVISEMRHQLEQLRQAHQIVQRYEKAAGCPFSKPNPHEIIGGDRDKRGRPDRRERTPNP